MYYAQINADGIVFAVTETHSEHTAPDMIEVQSLDHALLGQKYADGVFSPVPPAPVRVLTKLQYMERFTDAELAAIYTAAKSVVQVEIWLEKFKLATEVNLDDPATGAGLQAMEAAGLLAPGRAAEILS